MPRIYILLPVHDRLESTLKFLKSLLSQNYGNYHLVLIDDGSIDHTAGEVSLKVKNLTTIRGRGNWWWAGGLHQGYLWLFKNKVDSQDLVLMINNDTEFSSDFFKTAVDLLTSRPKTLLLAQVYGKQSGKLIEAGIHADWRRLTFEHTDEAQQVNCLSTRGLFLRVSDLMDIGGFHPFLLPHYLSDYEFTHRAFRKGYRLITDPSLKLIVDELTTGVHQRQRKTGRAQFLKEYFSRRSSANPIYWLSFIALSCPWGLKPLNFIRVLYGGLATVFRKIFGIYNQKWH